MMALWLVTVYVNSAYAEMDENGIEKGLYTREFWKIYTDALRGETIAQFQTGVMFERGLGVTKNEAEAAKWYKKSAEQGHIDAQYNLGIMYASGRGVHQDEGQGMMWLALAAKQGDKEARKLLLEIIDRKLESNNKQTPVLKSDESVQSITPTTLVCKENAVVCTRFAGDGVCEPYKNKTVLTAKEKKGNYYKLSGIVINHKWRDYPKEGWIEESSVDIRR